MSNRHINHTAVSQKFRNRERIELELGRTHILGIEITAGSIVVPLAGFEVVDPEGTVDKPPVVV